MSDSNPYRSTELDVPPPQLRVRWGRGLLATIIGAAVGVAAGWLVVSALLWREIPGENLNPWPPAIGCGMLFGLAAFGGYAPVGPPKLGPAIVVIGCLMFAALAAAHPIGWLLGYKEPGGRRILYETERNGIAAVLTLLGFFVWMTWRLRSRNDSESS